MKKVLSCILVMVLLASAVLVVTPAAAQGIVVPGDKNGDKIVSKDELANVILPYMLGAGHLGLDEVREIAHIYAYYPRSITDSVGREVTIYKPVKRIVVLSPDEYQALRVLGADDKIAGITVEIERDWDWLIGEEKSSVGKRYGPDPEAVLACEPDLVIGEEWTIKTKLEGKIQEDIPMVVLSFAAIEIIDEELGMLGYVLEKEDVAEDYLSNFRDKYVNQIEAQTEGLSDEERPKMYVGVYPDQPYYVYFGGSLGVQYSIDVAGGKHIFEDLPDWGGEVDPEELINRTPDIAFYSTRKSGYEMDVSEVKVMREYIMEEIVDLNITAVKNGSVYMVDTRTFFYGPSHPVGLSYMAKILHPDLVLEDPKEIFREYLRDWLRTDYDLDEHGVFIYHPKEYPDGK
ncbi:MAG: ABC transporter substrate-binding protein [archaeon]|nr:ABC transporter substrate-binding protein [archaeon]